MRNPGPASPDGVVITRRSAAPPNKIARRYISNPACNQSLASMRLESAAQETDGGGGLGDIVEIEEQLGLAAVAMIIMVELAAIGAAVGGAAHDRELLQAGRRPRKRAVTAARMPPSRAIDKKAGRSSTSCGSHQVEEIALADWGLRAGSAAHWRAKADTCRTAACKLPSWLGGKAGSSRCPREWRSPHPPQSAPG